MEKNKTDINNKYNLENLEAEELIKDNKIMKEQDEYVEYSRAKEIVNYFMLFRKYDRKEDYSYRTIASSILQEIFPITPERKKRIIEKSINILSNEYHIDITQETSLLFLSKTNKD